MSDTSQYLIQIEWKDEKPDLAAIRALLEKTGTQLDPAYGPILVNPALGRYVVRGTATAEARKEAEAIPGVQFFADARISPISR